MNIEFPVFVCTKDSGEIQMFESLYDLQYHLEEIDVENAEYLVWDKCGKPVSLAVQKPVWINLESTIDLQQLDLKSCLEKYADKLGIAIKLKEESAPEFSQAYEQINAESKLRARPKFFKK